MRKLLTILLFALSLSMYGQDIKPTDANLKILQTPNNVTWYYNTVTHKIGMYKGAYLYNEFFSASQVKAKIDSLISIGYKLDSDSVTLKGYFTNFKAQNKVDKVSGKSLVADTEIAKIHALHADDQDLSNLVVKIAGKGLSEADVTSAEKTAITHSNRTALDNVSGVNTGDQNISAMTHANRVALDLVSGTNTGDETLSTIKTKLGITTLSGSNTGDQDLTGLVHSNRSSLDLVSGSNTGDQDLSVLVPKTTTVNGHALSGNISVTSTDLSLNNVTNDAQVKRTEMGANNGVSTLDAGGKVPFAQLPASLMIYKGNWSPLNNTPVLADGTGTAGWVYKANLSGSVNLGSGTISFYAGDFVIYNGTIWERSVGTDNVVSVNGQQGVVSLTTNNISENVNLYYTDVRSRSSISLTTTGSSGGSTYSSTTGVLNIPQYQAAGSYEPANANIQTHITNDSDLSNSNELNTSISWTDATNIIGITDAGGTKTTTITGFLESEVDGSTTNELQTISNTSDATSHTATLSSSGGSIKLVEGSGIGLATTGTALDGVVTISNTGVVTEVDGSVSNEGQLTVAAGTATTSIINSNTSGQTGVTLTVDGTNMGISETGNNITLSNLKPDQTVSLTNGAGISNTGTYPNFTITNTAPDQTVSITSGAGISATGTYPSFTVTNTAPDTYAAVTKGNLTESITGLQFDNTRQVIGGAADLSITSGYLIPSTASATEWDSKAPASGSGNYIQNQNSSAQSANMWISGNIKNLVNNNTDGFFTKRYSITANDFSGYYLGVTQAVTPTNYKGGIFFKRIGSGGVGDLILANNNIGDASNAGLSDVILTLSSDKSATFVSTIQATTAKLTNLTDGYLPYHISDASGLGNSPIYTDGTNVGIGFSSGIDRSFKIKGGANGIGIFSITNNANSSEILYSSTDASGNGLFEVRNSSNSSSVYLNGLSSGQNYILGSLGVGMNSTSAKVGIKANGSLLGLTYANDGGDALISWNKLDGTNLWSIGGGIMSKQDELSFRHGSTSVLYLADNHNVGIGYSTGTEITNNKLAVNGSIYSSSTVNSTGYLLNNNNLFSSLSANKITQWDGTVLNNAPMTVSGNNILVTGTLTATNISGTNTGDQILTVGGTSTPTIALSGSNTATFVAGGGITLSQSGGTITITSTSSGTTNLTYSTTTSTVTVISDTGTDATLPAATQSDAGVLNTVDKTKIDNIWVTAPQSLSGTTVTMTWTSGINAAITLTGNTTLTLTALPDGGEAQIEVINGSSSYTFNLNGSTGYTTEVVMGNNAAINTTIGSHTSVVIWRRGSILYYGFIYNN